MSAGAQPTHSGAGRALWASTIAFTACFAVWTIFSIIGYEIARELNLSHTQFGLLVGLPILSGSLSRLFLGIASDRIGGRLLMSLVMLVSAAATFLFSFATTFELMLVTAIAIGLAGGGFAVGVPYVSDFYPPERQGLALGIFGAGNVGAAVTKVFAPFVLVAMGWQAVAQIWAAGLALVAIGFLVVAPSDPVAARRKTAGATALDLGGQFRVLRNVQVWRFSLYYFFVFGGFVALALWLPQYLVEVYGLDIRAAGMLAAFFSVPASLFRIYGGRLSDRFGARVVMYWTLGIAVLCTFMLSYPPTTYIIQGTRGAIRFHTEMALTPFLILLFVLGFFMSLGKAAVFKHIPVYYPHHVGAVGGLVGMIGGLGGFILPIAFGALSDLTGIWTSCFALLFLLVSGALAWMHFAIRHMEQQAARIGASIEALPEFPEMQGLGEPGLKLPRRAGVIHEWRPEDSAFWQGAGKAIARRNLWISTYCLMLAFAVWMVWSVVVARLPAIGFAFSTDELFWLAAVPGISGATLRIFYSFLVPILGGRLWTTLSTASLLVPAFGIGYAVQNPETPYFIFLVLALLCGLGGGNFSSSMANISFFFPAAEKGNALAINAGVGNLGVSFMQFIVPVAVTMSLFGFLGGQAQATSDGARIWMQNAGFLWVPLILLGTIAAWIGMNDIASVKSSFADQATIFGRFHNWLMCWLYTGTFGTFIGMSAGFPLLSKMVFPQVDALKFAFIGPLVGAIARAGSGWIADRLGGAIVTFYVFLIQIAAVGGMIWALGDQSFPMFFAMVLLLFLASGVGNASTFQMVPAIMRYEVNRAYPAYSDAEKRAQTARESAAVIGFSSAIAAYGAFYIPKAYGSSIQLSGSANAALWGFLAFYVTCAILTWVFYLGPRSILNPSPVARPAIGAKGRSIA